MQLALFTVAQVVGGVVGSAFLRAAIDERQNYRDDGRLGALYVRKNANDGQAFLWEFMATFIVLLVFVETSYNKRVRTGNVAALAQGIAYFVGAAITEQWTGGGMNPARAFGPALVADRWDEHWVWWVAPYIAALIVIPLAAFVFNVAELAFVSSGSSRPVAADEEDGHPMRVVDQK